ncbi:MAG: phage head-tail joining protein [Oceanicaulis sp.]
MTARWTQADYDELKRAIATGATSVSYNGQRVDYRSLEEMKGLLSEMESELGLKTRRRRSKATFDRGL